VFVISGGVAHAYSDVVVYAYNDDPVPADWHCDTVDSDGVGHNCTLKTTTTQERSRNDGTLDLTYSNGIGPVPDWTCKWVDTKGVGHDCDWIDIVIEE